MALAKDKRDSEITIGVSVKKAQTLKAKNKTPKRVALLDLGVNESLLLTLTAGGYEIIRIPYDSEAAYIMNAKPKAVIVSPGPGNPADLCEVVKELRKILGKMPVFGIGLGACVVGQALGCSTKKLKVGHHGANQPVKNIKTKRSDITHQNHSYVIDEAGLAPGVEISYVNLNDGSAEGFRAKKSKASGIHFIPNDLKEFEELLKHA